MSRIFHVWWLVIVAIIVIALILVWALYSGSQSLSANSLYDAVNSSAQYAREKGSRMDRGTFVINRNLFQKRLAEYKIKGYGHVGSKGKPTALYVHYLLDNHTFHGNKGSDDNNNGKIINGYVGAGNYKGNESAGASYVPIRAIQVSANSANHHQEDPNSIHETKGKYIATDVVQVNDEDRDQDQSSGVSDNRPIRNPNKTTRNSDDPTTNRFNGTDGSSYGSTNSTTVNNEAVDAND